MNNKYLEKVIKKYVIATLDIPTQYLISQNETIMFTTEIDRCTKFLSRNTANYIVENFYSSTGMYSLELVVLPITISYEIIMEDKEVLLN